MKLAMVFPGQGSQSVGMLDAFTGHDGVQSVLDRANGALGENLAQLIHSGPEADLGLTVNTQPAMLVAGLAVYMAWRQAGGAAPSVVAGHSLGEYTALAAAGGIALEDALRVVRQRAQAMQQAVPVGQGGMAAILGLSDNAVRAVCAEASAVGVVEAVNFNAPAQVVIAGAKAAVELACEKAKAAGAKRALPLPVSAPFHSSLMRPASETLAQVLAAVRIDKPQIPLVNNVDVQVETEPEAIRQALVRQAWHPVRWVETIQYFSAQGVTHVLECGPGKVLTGLVKRIDASLVVLPVFDPASIEQALAQLQASS